jgi:hypothetical protein
MISAAQQKKLQKQRAAFFGLARVALAFVSLALTLSQQPFLIKPRQSGENALKLAPLKLAVCGGIHWAAESPMVTKNPKLFEAINITSQMLMTPYEFMRARNSKRSVDAEKTFAAAYRKANKAVARAADGDKALRTIALQPMPNVALLGAYAVVTGCLFAPLLPGAEYAIAIGCGMLVQGSRSFGMEPQPELYMTGVLAVIAVVLMDAAKPKKDAQQQRKKRR